MKFDSVDKLPQKVKVGEIVSSRYSDNVRPFSWDQRKDGVDVVRTEDGQVLKLWCDGGQSPPKRGWTLMLRGGDIDQGYQWTLYGMPRETKH